MKPRKPEQDVINGSGHWLRIIKRLNVIDNGHDPFLKNEACAVTANIKTIATVQKPTALCRSQLKRFQPTPRRSIMLRLQFLIPGHQITIPVKLRIVSRTPPVPFTSRPFSPPNR